MTRVKTIQLPPPKLPNLSGVCVKFYSPTPSELLCNTINVGLMTDVSDQVYSLS